jgi:hypothetical protein
MLDEHPDITWDGEIFEPSHRSELGEPAGLVPAELIARRKARAPRHYGFETKYLASHHLGALGISLPDYVSMLEGLGFHHFVALHRRNYLRRVVSGAVGRAAGAWHRSRPGVGEPVVITLDPQHVPFGGEQPLLDVFAELAAGEELLHRLLPESALWLTYEDDIAVDPGVAYRRICELIGVEPAPVAPKLFPTNPFRLRDMLANYDEIAAELSRTSYEWMLSD